MKIPLLVAIKHDVIVSLTVRWNVEFLVPYETIYRNLSTEKRKDIYIKVRFTFKYFSYLYQKSNLLLMLMMIVVAIIFHPFDLTMKSLLCVQPVVDRQKFGVFRFSGDPTNNSI